MKIYYYLFGSEITKAYFEEEFSVVLKLVAGCSEYSIVRYNTNLQHPSCLLDAASGWGGYAEITAGEYYKIEAIEKRQNT